MIFPQGFPVPFSSAAVFLCLTQGKPCTIKMITFNPVFESSLVVVCALCLDKLFGEPARFHPLVGFGRYAGWVERIFYSSKHTGNGRMFLQGVLAWCVSVLVPLIILVGIVSVLPYVAQVLISVVVLYLSIGARSLAEHAHAVSEPLAQGNLQDARLQLGRIVSRDTQDLNSAQISSATVETLTENTHDAVIAPIVWFLLFGAAGVLLFRLANTLDAMWGYQTSRYEYFGKCSARVDDVLGWLSARLTVGLFILVGLSRGRIIGCEKIYHWARNWYSPNAGPVMAAGAFVLNTRLGGPAPYHGVLKTRPWLGIGDEPSAQHIQRAIGLMYQSTYVLVFILCVIGVLQWLY